MKANYKLQRTVPRRGRTVRALNGVRGPVRKCIVAVACRR